MENIGIYGGSFNPVTRSHIEIGKQLIEKGYLDKIYYLPCYKSLHNKNLIDGYIRVGMLNNVIAEDGCDEMSVCTWEIDNKASGRTIDVITDMLKEQRIIDKYNEIVGGDTDIRYHFIIGMDNAENIDKFQDWEKVIASAPFIVINRGMCESKHGWYKKNPPYIC